MRNSIAVFREMTHRLVIRRLSRFSDGYFVNMDLINREYRDQFVRMAPDDQLKGRGPIN